MKLKKYEKNPIIAPNPANAWENLVTCNPGVIYDDGRFYMLYRAAGDDKEHVIRLGLAVSENGFDFRRVGDSPVFGPSADGPDGGCVEDPRIVKFDNEFYITYAYRAHAPGQYWTFAHDVVRLPQCGAYAPAAMAQNLGNTGLAVTTDFRNFRRLGRLTSPVLDDRDVILFPEKIGGKFAMMHRPKQFVGERYGVKYPVGALLLDRENPLRVLARTPEPILEPEFFYETEGFYSHCVFPTGNVVVDGVLYVYYGGADKYVGVATCRLEELLNYLTEKCRCE